MDVGQADLGIGWPRHPCPRAHAVATGGTVNSAVVHLGELVGDADACTGCHQSRNPGNTWAGSVTGGPVPACSALDAAPPSDPRTQYPQRLGRPSAGHQQAGGSEDQRRRTGSGPISAMSAKYARRLSGHTRPAWAPGRHAARVFRMAHQHVSGPGAVCGCRVEDADHFSSVRGKAFNQARHAGKRQDHARNGGVANPA